MDGQLITQTLILLTGGSGGTPNGRDGSRQNSAMNKGWTLSFTQSSGNYGSGGGGRSVGAQGGTGGFDSKYVSVTTGQKYTVTVGKRWDGKNQWWRYSFIWYIWFRTNSLRWRYIIKGNRRIGNQMANKRRKNPLSFVYNKKLI